MMRVPGLTSYPSRNGSRKAGRGEAGDKVVPDCRRLRGQQSLPEEAMRAWLDEHPQFKGREACPLRELLEPRPDRT